MAYPNYRSQFGDTTFTKVFVGGLAWETPTEEMRRYFEQFGEILEAVVITDKNTGKSKGYGFLAAPAVRIASIATASWQYKPSLGENQVTFRDPESARRACSNPNPVIDGRRANCNIASLGRPRPSPPRGRPQGGTSPYQGSPSYSGVPTPPPPPPIIYPQYGYPPYSPDYGYHQALYNTQLQMQQSQQYYHQMYGTSSSAVGMGSPFYYHGYSVRGAIPANQQPPRVPSYVYYPTSAPPDPSFPPPRLPFPQSRDSQQTQRNPNTETEAGGGNSGGGGGAVTSESSN